MTTSIICEYCGNEFYGDFLQPYCSKLCIGKACGFSLQIKNCNSCGQEFETFTSEQYCSFNCITLSRNSDKTNFSL